MQFFHACMHRLPSESGMLHEVEYIAGQETINGDRFATGARDMFMRLTNQLDVTRECLEPITATKFSQGAHSFHAWYTIVDLQRRCLVAMRHCGPLVSSALQGAEAICTALSSFSMPVYYYKHCCCSHSFIFLEPKVLAPKVQHCSRLETTGAPVENTPNSKQTSTFIQNIYVYSWKGIAHNIEIQL